MEVKRRDRQAAEQLDRYIDASQQGTQTQEEYPFVDELLTMAKSIEAGPTLGERVTNRMNARIVFHRPVRWAMAAAALVLILGAFLTVPAVRSFARSIIGVFSIQETDQNPALRPTIAPPPGASTDEPSGPNPVDGLTLEQVRAEVAASSELTFDVVTPSYLPASYSYETGMVDGFGRMVLLTYVSADRLNLFHLRMYDLANPNPAVNVDVPLGASSAIEAVTVNGQAADYARGDYGADGSWDATAPVQHLAWRDGGVLYFISTHEQSTEISQDDLLAIAESLGQ